MFQAGGFGVAATVSFAQSRYSDPDPEPLPAGVTRRRTRLVELVDPAGMAEAELVGQLATISDARAQLAAFEAGWWRPSPPAGRSMAT